MMFRRVAAVMVASVVCVTGWAGTASAARTAPSAPAAPSATYEVTVKTDTYDLAGNLVSALTLSPITIDGRSGIQGSGGAASNIKSASGCRNQTFIVSRKVANVTVFTINKGKHYCWSSNRVYGPNGTGSDPAISFWLSYTLGQTQLVSWHWASNYYFNYSGLGANSGHNSQVSVQMKTCAGPFCFTEFPYIRVEVRGNGTWLWQWYDGD